MTDVSECIPAAFAVINELTAEHGLVTSNAVTGILATAATRSRRRRIRPSR